MSVKLIIKHVIIFAFVLLWIYAASSKLIDFNRFRGQMQLQILPVFFKDSLVYILPPLEVIAALLLLFDLTQLIGITLSLALILAFTIYIGLVVFRFFDHIPCSCGGILSNMGWDAHFIFNLIFSLLAALGFYIIYGERREKAKIG
ncbi:MAG: hypothetical protein JST19_12485 [Bacteroidetes bacterium]|nr:hypothetical protein [Bacteroidota bacterium]